MTVSKKLHIAIIGLGYVGLPLLLEISKKFLTVGFDKNKKKIAQLKSSIDITGELSQSQIKDLKKLKITNQVDDLKKTDIFIVAVPTPINKSKKPDLKMICDASTLIGKILKKKT